METENKLERFKKWWKRHKTAIVVGTIAVTTSVIGVILNSRKAEEQTENQENNDELTEAWTWDGEGDRYVIDKETMDQLPSGTYNVFDMYENERVDFVVGNPQD